MTSEEIQQAIASENVPVIQSVKGIGAKTAQRVIVDLKDKILKTFDLDEVSRLYKQYKQRRSVICFGGIRFCKKTI